MIQNKQHFFNTEITFDLLDPGMAVYHPNYLVLCDRARTKALFDAGYPLKELWDDGFALALRENNSDYFKPATMSQTLTIITTTTDYSGSTLKVQQKIVPSDIFSKNILQGYLESDDVIDPKQVIYQVSMTLVCVRLNPIKPTRLPERLVNALKLQTK